ncbi:MAG: hypothetical protein ACYCSN_12380 [Acidobacteriaceae bacterium]|nr:hypothetical protein [Thiomonas sp.]
MSEQALIQMILSLASEARRDGLLALAPRADTESDPFLRKGLQMLAEGTAPSLIRAALEVDALRDALLKAIVIEGLAGISDGLNLSILQANLRRVAMGF